jgi:hypothetical protein
MRWDVAYILLPQRRRASSSSHPAKSESHRREILMIPQNREPTIDAATAGSIERAALLEDIRVAEDQAARGEAVDHDIAREVLLARFRR